MRHHLQRWITSPKIAGSKVAAMQQLIVFLGLMASLPLALTGCVEAPGFGTDFHSDDATSNRALIGVILV